MSESDEEIIKPMPKAGKSITSKTTAITVKHPKISKMVLAAITALNETNGSSLHAIKKYISATYNVDTETKSVFIKKFLKNAVLNGELHQKKGKGATGSFIIPKKSIKLVEANKLKNFNKSVPKEYVVHVELNRPKLNAMNSETWHELGQCFNELNDNSDCRVIVLSAAGKVFTAGIDLNDIMILGQELADVDDIARKGRVLTKTIKTFQDSISSLEACRKPIIAAVHSACIGAGVDLITAADIRYCSKDAWFQVKEDIGMDIGMAADVGTLQRFPKVVGNQSWTRELCFTGRRFEADEAEKFGLVSKVFDTKEDLLKSALELAELIAQKSPLAVQTTKESIVYSMQHTNQEGLNHTRDINQLYLQSEDFINACIAQATSKGKEVPTFSKL